ncbi:MAG: DUF1080 domain-containing protein [Myxococcota bacterium]|nr:DUF1080 domain-containing protein [Myxococcota bacterium]
MAGIVDGRAAGDETGTSASGGRGAAPDDSGPTAVDATNNLGDGNSAALPLADSVAPDAVGGDSAAGSADAASDTGTSAAVSLFDGTTLSGWIPSVGTGIGNGPGTWNVQDGALHSTGGARGALISQADYGNFRLIFSVRQLVANIHYASVLIWGKRPPPPIDAIGGIQFGVPNGNYWDYRPGKNGAGTGLFTQTSPGLSHTAWTRCEILADVALGTARMACCALAGTTPCKAVQVLQFHDPTAGTTGPIALQVHSAGTQDEYKDISIEPNPSVKDFITTK